MVKIAPVQALWLQLAKFFYLLSGLHSDLLILRICLFVAYLFLLVDALVGAPGLWLGITGDNGLSVDGLVWSLVGLYCHGSSLITFLLDERQVQFSEAEAALWRLFYRSGGLSARLFKNIVAPYMHVVDVKEGDVIPTEDNFYIIYTGCVQLEITRVNQQDYKELRKILSGQMFPIKILGLLGPTNVFSTAEFVATAATDTKLFCFSATDMKRIATHKFAKGVWQALILNQLPCVVEDMMQLEPVLARETCDKVFLPLQKWEEPEPLAAGSGLALRTPFAHIWRSIQKQIALPVPFGKPPTGLRQTQLPAPTSTAIFEMSRHKVL